MAIDQPLDRKNKLPAILSKVPTAAFVLAIVLACALIAVQVRNLIRWDDTQGVEYDQARLKAYRSGGGEGGNASTGYGKGRPSPPPSALKAPGSAGGYGGGGYAGR